MVYDCGTCSRWWKWRAPVVVLAQEEWQQVLFGSDMKMMKQSTIWTSMITHWDNLQSCSHTCQILFEELHCVQLASPGEIAGLTFNTTSNHLVACNHNSVVQLFTIDGLMKTHVIFLFTIKNFVPKAIKFGWANGNRWDMLAFDLHDGQMWGILSFYCTLNTECVWVASCVPVMGRWNIVRQLEGWCKFYECSSS
jgi:hypothetical protein